MGLIGDQQQSLGSGIAFKRGQLGNGGSGSGPQINFTQSKAGLIFIRAKAELARGSEHGFEFLASLGPLAQLRLYAGVCQRSLKAGDGAVLCPASAIALSAALCASGKFPAPSKFLANMA